MPRSATVRLNNPELLAWARETAGYDVEDVADWFKKPAGIILAWEQGDEAPTYRQLQRFARKVRRPVAALFLPEEPDEPSPPEDFRVLPGQARDVFTPDALLAFRELRSATAELRTLLDDLRDPLELALPRWRSLRDESVIPRAAGLRESLGITFDDQIGWGDAYEALNEWRNALFDHGVVVQIFPVPVEDLRAFSVLANGLGGVGISTKDARAARVFSLFHEVAHLCLRKPGVSGETPEEASPAQGDTARLELYCDAFAAAFLLPHGHPAVTQALHELQDDLTMQRALYHARRFKVSKYVIARRMLDLGRLERDYYWDEISRWRQHDAQAAAEPRAEGGGGNYLRNRVSRAGRRYVTKVMEAVDEGVLTTYEAGNILSLRPDRLEDARSMAS